MTPDNTPNPLGPMALARNGLAGLTNNLGLVGKTAALPMLILTASSAVQMFTAAFPANIPATAIINASLILMLIGLLLMMSYSISWRRYMVIGTRPSIFYFGRGFWSYIGRTSLAMVGFAVITLAVYIVLMVALNQLPEWRARIGSDHFDPMQLIPPDQVAHRAGPVFAVIGLSVLPGMWWLTRHLPYFTAKAVEDHTLTWRATSPLMRGHVIPYVTGAVIAIIPLFAAQVVIVLLMRAVALLGSVVLEIVLTLMLQAIAFGWVIVSATIGAYFYTVLVVVRADCHADQLIN